MKRIEKKFAELKKIDKTAFVAYICAGDPDFETSLEILKGLPKNGVDIIELGIPFLDPAGDGPVIEESAKRAIKAGMSFKKVLQMVAEFRKNDDSTPIILMGYYNSFLKYGLSKIFFDAQKSGADGVLIVDLPLEEREEINLEIKKTELDLINLISPISDEKRIAKIVDEKYSSGFLYLISMLGITGTKSAQIEENKINLAKIRAISNLPVAIGFGIKTPQQIQEFSQIGVDGAVVGSVIVDKIAQDFLSGKKKDEIVNNALLLVKEFGDFCN